MKNSIILLFLFFFSCYEKNKEINIAIQNNSDFKIDSLAIVLNNSEVKYRKVLHPIDKIDIKLNLKSSNKESSVFGIYYYQNGNGFRSNFGYHESYSFIKDRYNLFIFNEGVSEINQKTPHLKENKNFIDN